MGKKKKREEISSLQGVETVKKLKSSIKLKIPVVTFYVFSENWRRPKKEIRFLFKLIHNYFSKEIKSVQSQGIKINILGDLNKLNKNLKDTLKKSVKLTKNNKQIIVNLAINYGARNEILNASKKNKFNPTIKKLEKNLYTKNLPDPDILIRTGGHKRLNFMLWQLVYSELFFLKIVARF